MKKIQKIVLSVLLFTFAFITVHDYVVSDISSDVTYELSHLECEDTAVDLSLHLHENIHSLLIDNLFARVSFSIIHPYQKILDQRDYFISHINLVPQRPPLT